MCVQCMWNGADDVNIQSPRFEYVLNEVDDVKFPSTLYVLNSVDNMFRMSHQITSITQTEMIVY